MIICTDKLDKNTTIFDRPAGICDQNGPKLTKLYRYMDADFVKEKAKQYQALNQKLLHSNHRW